LTGAMSGAVNGLMNQTVGRALPTMARGLMQAAVDQTVRRGAKGAKSVVAKATSLSRASAPGKTPRSR
jgi:hypothetical protein